MTIQGEIYEKRSVNGRGFGERLEGVEGKYVYAYFSSYFSDIDLMERASPVPAAF